MTSARHILIVFTAIIALIYSGGVEAKPLTRAEQTVCKNLSHCLGIVKRHSPESYDYTLLSQEFLQFGEKGRNALLDRLDSKKNETMRRALILLNRPQFRFSPKDQQRIAKQWRTSPSPYLTSLMSRLYSPIMREAFISTLSHDDFIIRDLSRRSLALGEAQIRNATPKNLEGMFRPPQDNTVYTALVRAIFDAPTPTLLSLLDAYPPSKTQTIFIRLLETNDPEIMIAAYEALNRHKKTSAPQVLRRRLNTLSDGSQTRSIGNIVALLILKDHIKKEAHTSFNFSSAMGAEIDTLVKNNLIDIWQYLKTEAPQAKVDFIDVLKHFPLSSDIETIISEAFSERRDYRVTIAAINNIGFYKIKAATKSLEAFARDHPIRDVRLASLNAIDRIQGRSFNSLARAKQVQNTFAPCPVKLTNFKAQSRQLPYFDDYIQVNGNPFRRADLSSATAISNGWLAGYAPRNTQGGLVYFDNKTGASELLLDRTTLFVAPAIQPLLGKTAKQVWVVSHASDAQNKESSLQSLTLTDDGFSIHLQAILPAKPIGFVRLKDDSVIMTFAPDTNSVFKNTAHPPLRLFPNGNMVLGCQSSQKRG